MSHDLQDWSHDFMGHSVTVNRADIMGGKRNKLKKAFSPPQLAATPAIHSEDDDLMNDLMAELDSRDKTVQSESAAVLNQMQLNQQSQQIESARKREPKRRFQARQVYS